MPKQLEAALKKSAKALGLEPGSDRYRAYVYGTLRKVKDGSKGKAANEQSKQADQ